MTRLPITLKLGPKPKIWPKANDQAPGSGPGSGYGYSQGLELSCW